MFSETSSTSKPANEAAQNEAKKKYAKNEMRIPTLPMPCQKVKRQFLRPLRHLIERKKQLQTKVRSIL